MSDNKEFIGIDVSEFYNYFIILHHYNWAEALEGVGITNDETTENEMQAINIEASESSDKVLHVTYDKIGDVVNLMTNKILALNDQLSKKVKEQLGENLYKRSYAVCGRIIFSDVESLEPLESIGKFRKDFYVRFSLYKALDKSQTVDVEKLQIMLKEAIIRDLLNVVEELKQEETFTPPATFLKKFESIGIKS